MGWKEVNTVSLHPSVPTITHVSFRMQRYGINNRLLAWPFSCSPQNIQLGVRAASFHVSPQPLSVVDPAVHRMSGPASDPGDPLTRSSGCTAGRQLLQTPREPVGSEALSPQPRKAWLAFCSVSLSATASNSSSWEGHYCHLLAVSNTAPSCPSGCRSGLRCRAWAQAQVLEALLHTGP